MSLMQIGTGVAGGFLQAKLMKQRKADREDFNSKLDALIQNDSGVVKNSVVYGDDNATQGTLYQSPEVATQEKEKKEKLARSTLSSQPTAFYAEGGVIGSTAGGYYHGGMGGCPDRMSWQEANFKK